MTVGVDNYVYVDNYFVFDRVAVPVGIVAVVDMVLEGKCSVVGTQSVEGMRVEDYTLPYSFLRESHPFHFGIPGYHTQVEEFLLGIPSGQVGSYLPGRAYLVGPFLIGSQNLLFRFLLETHIGLVDNLLVVQIRCTFFCILI